MSKSPTSHAEPRQFIELSTSHATRGEALRITSPILAFVAEVDECKGTWRALRDLAPEQQAALRHVATIESIGSSTTIERARLSDQHGRVSGFPRSKSGKGGTR